MATLPNPDTEQLLEAVSRGDAKARGPLLERHRPRLRRMVAIRLDRRLAARLDASDIVQESLVEAANRLDDYLGDRQLPFYPWLRRIASDRLADAYRMHVLAGRRSVEREEPPGLSGASVIELAERLLASNSAASARIRRNERLDRIRLALQTLADRDQEILVLRYLEDLTTTETAAVLDIGEGAVKMRLLRALQRLRDVLHEEDLP